MKENFSKTLEWHLPELVEVQNLICKFDGEFFNSVELARVKHKSLELPVVVLEFGSKDPQSPVFFLTAGVHGLERIGSQVVLSYLKTLLQMASWDEATRQLLAKVRFCVVPIVNPVGMYLRTRSNGNGVDLMRNAPIDAVHNGGISIAAGHRISNRLPWYRGAAGAEMEQELRAIISYFENQFSQSSGVIALDVHSGFGARDRLWFPYARSKEPFPNLLEVFQLINLFENTYPHHVYKIEPQSASYTTHGDLWDYLYDRRRDRLQSTFIPLTLELGSWLWIKKNPRQVFSAVGIFNPLMPHRTSRILRRHVHLIDFLLRAVANPTAWMKNSASSSNEGYIALSAKNRWYSKSAA